MVDDEETQRESLRGFLEKKGYAVVPAASGAAAIGKLKQSDFDLIITDYQMPGMTGAQLLDEAKSINPSVPVIVMTAFGTVESAVAIMKQGAFDFLQKPIDLEELLVLIERAEERSTLIRENKQLRQQLAERFRFDGIVSASGEMEQALNMAARVARSKASVLIRGESGTGKELVAKAIHYASDRSDKPFVVVNCAAMPETLFESELFGHEKGAFTGADKPRAGKFEQAHGGTLFIDEVGDIPMPVQVKLLRAVQFGSIERLGSNKTISTDVRIITATNRNLEKMIETGEFREDLFYRFNVVAVHLPPLRARKSDIPILVDFFLKKYAGQSAEPIEGVSREAMDALIKYHFPGNVRELENIIQRAAVLARKSIITTKDLPSHVWAAAEQPTDVADGLPSGLNDAVEQLERKMIGSALAEASGNQSRAAELLGINERTLRYKMSKYGISLANRS